MKVWILVFMFNGVPMASGPHELEVCLYLLEDRPTAHCWNPQTQERRRYQKATK